MLRRGRKALGALAGFATIGLGLVGAPQVSHAAVDPAAAVVINEVYGGGGNSGATFNADFVELYNKTASPVDVTGWSVQYKSATGTTWAVSATLNGSIAANDYLLVQASSTGANGAALPPPNAIGSSSVNLSGTNGNVALASVSGPLTCATTGCATDAGVVDLIGYGTGNAFATTPAPAPANSATSLTRTGFVNTANNGADFTFLNPPTPTAGTGVVEPPFEGTIAEIQGTGTASPHGGAVATTRGVVTAVYPTGGFNGYVIQTPGTGGDTDLTARTASDGLFIFSSSTVGLVELGDYIEITGTVSEFNGLTEITVSGAAGLTVLPDVVDPPLPITAPWPAAAADREKIESMLYAPPGAFTVTNTFSTNQFGEVGLASGTIPLRQPSDVARPGTPEFAAVVADNAARAVTLDDGASTNFLSAANTGLTPPYLSLTDPVRVGAAATFNTAVVVDWRNNAWKFQPLSQVTDTTPAAARTAFSNTRVAGPDAAALGSGDLKVATFNVLNYFTTLGSVTPGCVPFTDRTGNGVTVNTGCDLRGAWDPDDLQRQQDKIVAAINALDADVVGLMEVENSARLGEATDEAIGTLVAALNAAAGAGTWAFVPASADLPPASEMDVINTKIIYKPASVTPLGAPRALGTESGPGGAFEIAREPVGQSFTPVGGGEPFFVAVNHFKSKSCGSPPPPVGDPEADSGDGQSCFNAMRVREAQALLTWVPTALEPGVEDVFLLGDFNAYTQEDPMQVFYDAGFVDINSHEGNLKQSYSFSGLNGSLDHVLANPSALARVTGSDIWEINAPESVALEYSRYNYHGTLFYDSSPFRSSDHNPDVVAFNSTPSPIDLTLLDINDFHGRIDINTVKFAGTVEQQRALAGEANTAFLSAGDNIGASLFASSVAQDQPTIDVLNALDLDASAVGNHEFDQGYSDLIDRVIAGGTNAEFPILGANVYFDGTTTPALDEYYTFERAGLTIGVIGAVTEETPALVTPTGIAMLDFGDPVEAMNRVAAQLSDGNPSNGEADIIIASYHEGAGAGIPEGSTLEQEVAEGGAFADIVNLTSPVVDAIFTGHTHKSYAWDAPIPGSPGETRPIVQTGSYGENLGRVVLTIDPTTFDVISYTATNIPRTTTADAELVATYPRVAEVKAIVDAALANAAAVGNTPVGSVTANITTAYNGGSYVGGVYTQPDPANPSTGRDQRHLESSLGGLVADALVASLADPLRGGAEIGVVNPGGLRNELFYTGSPVGEGDGVVTYAEANAVLPFVNNLWTTTLTGAQFKTLLEQQWQRDANGNVPSRPYLQLGLSSNVTYTFDPTLPEGSRITSITINGQPYDPAADYRIGTFSFLIAGGDNFRIFTQSTDARDSGLIDRDAWIEYIQGNSPLSPDFARQSVQVTPTPTTAAIGEQLTFTASMLDLTSLGSPANTTLDVSIAGVALGTVPVTGGSANVSVLVPASVPSGAQSLVLVANPSGTTVTIPVTVADATAPAAPVITSPAAGSSVATTMPTIAGTAEPGSTVTVYDGATVVGTVPADAGGAWSLVSPALAQGLHSLTAIATDAAGNVSDASAAVAFTVDTVAPAKPRIVRPTNGSLICAATVPMRGTAEAGSTVTAFVRGVAVGTGSTGADGNWVLTTNALADGSQKLTVKATDAAGNVGPASNSVTVVVFSKPAGGLALFLWRIVCG